MNFDFGLDQISDTFAGEPLIITGPGVWLGEISITGIVPIISIGDSADQSYSF